MYKFFLTILFSLYFSNCKTTPPCASTDPNCNLFSSILIENFIKNLRDPKTSLSLTPAPGSFKFDQFVKINSSVSGLNIRYNLNSPVSCSSGFEYNPTRLVPISPTISGTTVSNPNVVLNVVACRNGGVNSQISETYNIRNSVKQISNIQFWYSASSLDLQDGQNINFLQDLSDNRNNLNGGSKISDDPTKDPVFTRNAINNFPSMKFSRVNGQFLYKNRISNLTTSLLGSSAVLIRKTSIIVDENFFSIGGFSGSSSAVNSRQFGIRNTGNLEHCPRGPNCNNPSNRSTSTLPLNQFVAVLSEVNSTGNASYQLSNTSAGSNLTPAFPFFSSIDQITVGVEPNLNGDFLEGEIVEVANTKGTLNELKLFGCYINDRYQTNISISDCPN